jgi:glycosyltransferase involved in cell wall biosynthesis
MKQPILVYRDRLIPRSEAAFMRRQYVGFDRLEPTWIGWHEDEGRADLQARTLMLGTGGAIGAFERVTFKQFGLLPSVPDLRALKPRLIHAHFGRGGALALPLARKLRVPLVVSFHGGDATKAKHYRRQLIPTLYQRRLAALRREAIFFVCVSDFIRDTLLARGFPAQKLRVVRYGIDLDPPPPGPGSGAGFLFVGRFVEKKGVPVLIEAFRLLAERGIILPLTLVGDGPLRAGLEELAAGLPGVRFAGWLPQAEVRRAMGASLALVVPSVTAAGGDAEGLPNVVLEAMAAAVPVIGTDHAGIAEAIVDGETGFVVPERDPQALAEALARIAADPGLRARLAAAGRRRAEIEFSAVGQSRRLEDVLVAAIEG